MEDAEGPAGVTPRRPFYSSRPGGGIGTGRRGDSGDVPGRDGGRDGVAREFREPSVDVQNHRERGGSDDEDGQRRFGADTVNVVQKAHDNPQQVSMNADANSSPGRKLSRPAVDEPAMIRVPIVAVRVDWSRLPLNLYRRVGPRH